MYTTKQKGFTIVELLIVIVVIAILAAISIVAFTGVQQRGRDSERISDISNIAKALTAATSEGAAWPTNAEGARNLLAEDDSSVNVPADVISKLQGDAADEVVSTNATTEYAYVACGTTGARIHSVKEANDEAINSMAGSC